MAVTIQFINSLLSAIAGDLNTKRDEIRQLCYALQDAYAVITQMQRQAEVKGPLGQVHPPTPKQIMDHDRAEGGRWLLILKPTLRTTPVEIVHFDLGHLPTVINVVDRWVRIANDGTFMGAPDVE